jgi:hypothetical protein
MIVTVNSDGEAVKATSNNTAIQDFSLAADSYKTFNNQYDREAKKITLLTANYNFKTARIANAANLTFQPNDHPLEDAVAPAFSAGATPTFAITDTPGDTVTYTIATQTLKVVGSDLTSNVTEGDRVTIPAVGSAAAQTLTVISSTLNVADTDIVVDPGELDLTNLLDPGTGSAYADQTAANDFAADYDGEDLSFTTPNVKVVIDEGTPADSTITFYGVDWSDEIAIGDQITLTAPATWDDDRDSTTDAVASTQAAQVMTATSVTLVGSDTVIEFDNATTALKDPGETAYDDLDTTGANPDTYVPKDFAGGAITFNRVVADFKPGVPVEAQSGNVAVLTGNDYQIVGHVTDTDPLLKTITVSPYTY